MQLLTQSKTNVLALELKRHLGVCYRAAWLIKHKILGSLLSALIRAPRRPECGIRVAELHRQ